MTRESILAVRGGEGFHPINNYSLNNVQCRSYGSYIKTSTFIGVYNSRHDAAAHARRKGQEESWSLFISLSPSSHVYVFLSLFCLSVSTCIYLFLYFCLSTCFSRFLIMYVPLCLFVCMSLSLSVYF